MKKYGYIVLGSILCVSLYANGDIPWSPEEYSKSPKAQENAGKRMETFPSDCACKRDIEEFVSDIRHMQRKPDESSADTLTRIVGKAVGRATSKECFDFMSVHVAYGRNNFFLQKFGTIAHEANKEQSRTLVTLLRPIGKEDFSEAVCWVAQNGSDPMVTALKEECGEQLRQTEIQWGKRLVRDLVSSTFMPFNLVTQGVSKERVFALIDRHVEENGDQKTFNAIVASSCTAEPARKMEQDLRRIYQGLTANQILADDLLDTLVIHAMEVSFMKGNRPSVANPQGVQVAEAYTVTTQLVKELTDFIGKDVIIGQKCERNEPLRVFLKESFYALQDFLNRQWLNTNWFDNKGKNAFSRKDFEWFIDFKKLRQLPEGMPVFEAIDHCGPYEGFMDQLSPEEVDDVVLSGLIQRRRDKADKLYDMDRAIDRGIEFTAAYAKDHPEFRDRKIEGYKFLIAHYIQENKPDIAQRIETYLERFAVLSTEEHNVKN